MMPPQKTKNFHTFTLRKCLCSTALVVVAVFLTVNGWATDGIIVTENVIQYGVTCTQIATASATYCFDKAGGGFVSMMDEEGYDWISHNKDGAEGSVYRGIPNLANVNDVDIFHPGYVSCTTFIDESHPVYVKITSQSGGVDGQGNPLWETVWKIYDRFAELTVTHSDAVYWFLYEGTPAGSFSDSANFYALEDGVQRGLDVSTPQGDFAESSPQSGEWIYFGNTNVNNSLGRSLFLVHHENDALPDLYKPFTQPMTILGFGRREAGNGLESFLQGGNTFTIGFVESTDHDEVVKTIESSIPKTVVTPAFTYSEIHPDDFGQGKAVGDLNNDGRADFVIAEGEFADSNSDGGILSWYKSIAGGGWQKIPITRVSGIIGDMHYIPDGQIADMDNDGDLDIIMLNWAGTRELWIFENPLLQPGGVKGDPETDDFILHRKGIVTSTAFKDVDIADFNSDGKLDVAIRAEESVVVVYQAAAFSPLSDWQSRTMTVPRHEGMAVGDINQDFLPDVVGNGWWLENPGTVSDWGAARTIDAKWFSGQSGNSFQTDASRVKVADLNLDGFPEPIFSHSELPGFPVSWYQYNPSDQSWTEHVIGMVDYCHTLEIGDINRDSYPDVVAGTLYDAQPGTNDDQHVSVFYNRDASGLHWQESRITGEQQIASYIGKIGDIDFDGDLDFVSCVNYYHGPSYLLENSLNPEKPALPVNNWAHKEIDNTRARIAFGLDDVAYGSGTLQDIVSGYYLYKNPGGSMTGDWQRITVTDGYFDLVLAMDVDGDANPDLIGQKHDNDRLHFYWFEALDTNGTSWPTQPIDIGSVAPSSHIYNNWGSQGHKKAQLIPGGMDELIVSGGDGISFFWIENNGGNIIWHKKQVSGNPSDEGFGVGDIDGDGFLDIAAGTGESQRVEWYRNPGDSTGDWVAYNVGLTAAWGDRFEIADLDGDNRADIIGTEEISSAGNSGAKTYWWKCPVNPEEKHPVNDSWQRFEIVDQASTNSMSIADIDNDNDIDIILGEHKGSLKLAIWQNNGRGIFSEKIIDSGKENHLGAFASDLDGDGDQDIVGIAFNDYPTMNLWINNAPTTGPSTVAAPSFSPLNTNHTGAVEVTILCQTAGATIYYTTGSEEPTENSIEYREEDAPLIFTDNVTIKAVAYKIGMAASSVASISYIVESDTEPPSITSLYAKGVSTRIILNFSEDLLPATAENVSNYQLDGLTVTNASLSGTTVTLTTTPMSDNVSYTLRVNNVEDLWGNTIAENTMVNFLFEEIAVSAGLTAYWNFDEGTGSIARDSSTGAHHADILGAEWTTEGTLDYGLKFGGDGDYLDAKVFLTGGTTEFSISLWLSIADFTNEDARLISKANGISADAHSFMMSTTKTPDNRMRMRFRLKIDGTTHTWIANSRDLQINEWLHVVGVYKDKEFKIYHNSVDNEADRWTIADGTGIVTQDSTLSTAIGANPGGGDSFHGTIDEVRVYNRALTESEIEELSGYFHGGEKPAKPDNLRISIN